MINKHNYDKEENQKESRTNLLLSFMMLIHYFEVGNGSRHTLKRVPEMMDTPPIQNNNDFIVFIFYLDRTE
nr:MAG TPA: hypothetical protein [Caudoviricetes sp.]